MIQFQRTILDNGLVLLVHEDHSSPFVTLNILYDVGARDEQSDKTGFAHLFEHLMFGGSVNIPNYDEPLQKVGGENNAYTTNDLTNYYCTLPAENVETAFWLESDRMLSLAFTEKSLEVQRSVVIEEFKQRYLNQPYGDTWLKIRPLAYKVHPYQWATIGKEISHIENAVMDDVKAFFKKHYCPANAILVVAGNINYAEALRLSKKWFEPIHSGEKPKRNLPIEPLQKEARRLNLSGKVPVNMLYKVFHMPDRRHQDYHSVDLISDILSRGNSSRFFKNLVMDKQVFSDVHAYVSGDLDPGLMVISGKINEGITFDSAENAVNEELENLKKKGTNKTELQKCKNKIESSLIFSEMDIPSKAANLAYAELLGDASLINDEKKKYDFVNESDILRMSNEIFKEENSSTLLYSKE